MKKNATNTFLKNSVLFLIGSVFSKILSFILLPLYTSYIPTSDFGVYDITTMMIQMISSVVYFEIWSAMLRYLYDFNAEKKVEVIKSSLVIFACSTVLFTFASTIFCLIYNPEYISLVIAWGIATALATYLGFLTRGLNKNISFAVSGIINTAVCLVANIVLIIVWGFNYSALYIGSLLGACAQIVHLFLNLKIIKKVFYSKMNINLTKELLKYALPLSVNTAAYWLLHSSARLIYNYYYGNSASGIFSVGNKFSNVIVLATTCFTYAWQDLSFSQSNTGWSNRLYSIACEKYMLFLSGVLALSLPVIKVVFPYLVNGGYGEAIDYVPAFLMVALLSGYSSFVGNVFYAIKDTKIISISTAIAGSITFLLAFPLVKMWGANGTNIAVMIGFIVNIIIRFIILKRKINFNLQFKTIAFCLIWIVIATFVYYNLAAPMNLIAFTVYICAFVIAFKNDILKFIKK